MAEKDNMQSTVVVIDGSMTRQNSSELRHQLSDGLQRAEKNGHKELIVSWESPGDIDGIGLALLLATHLEISTSGGQVCLRGFSEKQQELLKITRTDRVFAVQDEAA